MNQTKTNGAAVQTVEKTDSEILQDVLSQSLYKSLANKGDISELSTDEKTSYMQRLCESLGLNHLTQPFIPITLKNKNPKTNEWEAKEVLYATRGCTDQLASNRKLTREIIKTERIEDVYVATARVIGPDGRFDISTGAVTIGSLKGDSLANALMKAETKAKRRATLCYCGLGFLDESEIETIPKDRVEFANPPSKGEMVEKYRGAPGSAGPEIADAVEAEKPLITPAEAKAEKAKILNEMSPEDYAKRVEIENLTASVGVKPDAILHRFDTNPDKRDLGLNEVRKEAIRRVTASKEWPYSEDATTQLLEEKFGITVIAEASPEQLEACVNAFRADKYLK